MGKKWCCILLALLMVFQAAAVTVFAEEEEESEDEVTEESMQLPSGSSRLIDTFRTSHPRLIVNDFDPIRQKLEDNYLLQRWYLAVKREADELLEEDPLPYQTEDANEHILSLSRKVYRRAYVLAFAYNIENDVRYKDRLWEEMESVANYPSWCPHSFLGTAETTHAVAIAYDWCYQAWTEEQLDIMRNAMITKSFEPAMVYYDGGRIGTGTRFPSATHNWNAVCNDALMMGAIAIFNEEPDFAETILQNVAATLPRGLECYRTGGAYPEGTMYWSYGTNYLTYGMASLDTAVKDGTELPEELSFYKFPGISETPDYMIHMIAPTGTFNSGDASTNKNGGGPIMYWFAQKYQKPHYAWSQLEIDRNLDPETAEGFGRVLSIIWYLPELDQPGDDVPLDKVYQSEDHVNLVLLQDSPSSNVNGIYAGLQGGDNRTNHAYLSLGTFMIEALGVRWATMRGAGDYEWPNYFSIKDSGGRYEYYNTRAEGQNTLVINPSAKADQDIDAIAPVVRSESSDNEAYGIIDLTQAYAEDVNSALRGIRLFDNRSRIVVQDEVDAKSAIHTGYWFMHTAADVQISADGRSATLFQDGKRMRVNIIEGPENARFTYMDAKPLPTSPNPEVIRNRNFGKKLAIDFSGEQKFKLAVEFVPLYDNQAPPQPMDGSPDLADWKIEDSANSLGGEMGSNVALMAGSPYTYFNQYRSYIDMANPSVITLSEDGQLLLPMKYLSDCFGALTEWNAEQGSMDIYYRDVAATITSGSSQVTINGEPVTMAAPARIENDRMYLPAEIAAEIFGKALLVDDSGVILLANTDSVPEGTELEWLMEQLRQQLGYRLAIDGTNADFFTPEAKNCNVLVQTGSSPSVELETFDAELAPAVLQSSENNQTVFQAGEQTYQINCLLDPYEYQSRDDGVRSLNVTLESLGTGDVDMNAHNWYENVVITASKEGTYPPENLNDNSISTLFTLEGTPWIQFDFGEKVPLHSMAIATSKGNERSYNFDLQVSDDGQTWTDVMMGASTSGTSVYPDIFELGDISARYVKYTGHGNSANAWTSLSEVRFYESAEQQAADQAMWDLYFKSEVGDAYILALDEVLRLHIKGIRNDAKEVELDGSGLKKFVVTSSNPDVLEVDLAAGTVTAKGLGEATITVDLIVNNLTRTETVDVVVTE
mgnify:CR=1 FL=1